jgi:hypothetical protein
MPRVQLPNSAVYRDRVTCGPPSAYTVPRRTRTANALFQLSLWRAALDSSPNPARLSRV